MSLEYTYINVYVVMHEHMYFVTHHNHVQSCYRRTQTLKSFLQSGLVVDKHILNVDFYDGDKEVGVPFNLVKRQDGQFCDETVTLD